MKHTGDASTYAGGNSRKAAAASGKHHCLAIAFVCNRRKRKNMSSSLQRDALNPFAPEPEPSSANDDKDAMEAEGSDAKELPNLLSKSHASSSGDSRAEECDRIADQCAGARGDDSSCVARARSTSMKIFSAHSRESNRRAGDWAREVTRPVA